MRQKQHDARRHQLDANTDNSRQINSRSKHLRLQNIAKQYNTMKMDSYLDEIGAIISI